MKWKNVPNEMKIMKMKEVKTTITNRKGNIIGASWAKAISESLKINTTLTDLDLNSDDKTEKREAGRKKNETQMKW